MKNEIVKLHRNLFFDKAIEKKQSDLYVPIYDEEIKDLRQRLMLSELENQTFYLAGQSGSGKSTALNFLPDRKILSKYKPVYINYRDLLAFEDVDIIDVLLMFAYRMSEESPKIHKKFYKLIEKLHKIHQQKIEEFEEKSSGRSGMSEFGIGGDIQAKFFSLFQLGAKFFSSFKMDKAYRQVTREFFFLKKRDLLDIVNDIVEEWYAVNGTSRKLLVFFDDFDKLRRSDQIKAIFIENRNFFEDINCRKVISVPVHLATEAGFNTPNTFMQVFTLKLNINPLTAYSKKEQNTAIAKNKRLLTKIVKKRDPNGLIEKKAIDLAIEYSGGILRQFIQLLREAAFNVIKYKGTTVTVDDVEKALFNKRQQLSLTIIGDKIISLLNYVMKHNKPSTTENNDFVNALLNLQIIAHPNNEFWYDINPIIKSTVTTYAKDLEE
jgi:hypothetical protein